MKSVGYILLGLVSLFTFTSPSYKLQEIPIRNIKIIDRNDSLRNQLNIKIDSLEAEKAELIQLQSELGIR